MAKLTKGTSLILAVSFIIWSVILYSLAYSAGMTNQKQIFASKNKPLVVATATEAVDSIKFTQATDLAKAKNFDGAIALLTPEVASDRISIDQRVQGMNLIAQYYQAKADPESALKWDLEANKLSGTPNLQATLGAASASAQLYGMKSAGPDGPKGAQSYKQAALEYYNQALSLANDPTIKTQIGAQISALNKAK
ncbi:MAG: hypothetical protein ABIS59_02650 [Candidatus Saccharibacteria bacterium]